jgi:hypothetical protein
MYSNIKKKEHQHSFNEENIAKINEGHGSQTKKIK